MHAEVNVPGSRLPPERLERLRGLVGEGATLTEIRERIGVDPRTVKKHFPGYRPPRRYPPRSSPERLEQLRGLVESNTSLMEIQRTMGMDHRTVRNHHPGYKPFPQGGGGDAAIIRQVNQDLKRIDNTGVMSTRRGRN